MGKDARGAGPIGHLGHAAGGSGDRGRIDGRTTPANGRGRAIRGFLEPKLKSLSDDQETAKSGSIVSEYQA